MRARPTPVLCPSIGCYRGRSVKTDGAGARARMNESAGTAPQHGNATFGTKKTRAQWWPVALPGEALVIASVWLQMCAGKGES